MGRSYCEHTDCVVPGSIALSNFHSTILVQLFVVTDD